MENIIIFYILIIYFVLLIIFNLFRKTTQGIENPYINLLKPLVPSWKFFDDYEETRLFFCRIKREINGDEEQPFTEWFPIYQTPPSNFARLFINPQGNLTLAAQSHISTLLSDLESLPENEAFEETLSYKIANNFICYYVNKKFKDIKVYQFKLTIVDSLAAPKEDIFISPLYINDSLAVETT